MCEIQFEKSLFDMFLQYQFFGTRYDLTFEKHSSFPQNRSFFTGSMSYNSTTDNLGSAAHCFIRSRPTKKSKLKIALRTYTCNKTYDILCTKHAYHSSSSSSSTRQFGKQIDKSLSDPGLALLSGLEGDPSFIFILILGTGSD